MVGCVLTGHGTFANGLADALKMIAGEQEAFVPVPFIEAGAATYPETLSATISDLLDTTDGVLVFCDLLGGTPFNQAMIIAQSYSNVQTFLCFLKHLVVAWQIPLLKSWLILLFWLVARELSISVLSLRLSQKMTSSETMVFK